MSEQAFASNEEPFEDPGADDEMDWSDDVELADDEFSDDLSTEELSSAVADAGLVEEIPAAGWANQPPAPLEFPEISQKEDG